MKRLLLAGLALLVAGAAFASTPAKLAVFVQSSGTSGDQNWAVLAPLMTNGTPFDVFDADFRSWGATGTDDSVWFSARYHAVLIAREAGQSNGVPVASGPYGLNFKNAAGTANIGNSPLSGRWGIPVFCLTPNRSLGSATYTDSAQFVNGLNYVSPVGTFGKPAVGVAGTWRYRMLCRLRGNVTDTLYCDPRNYGCRPSPWAGVGSVAALVWADTTFGGAGVCSSGDTIVAVWRYRPKDGQPGIYFSTLEQGLNQTGTNIATGVMIFLQYIYTITDIRPTAIIKVPIMEHDAEPNALDATGIALAQQLHDSLTANNIRRTISTPIHATEQFQYVGALAGIRAEMASRGNKWHPFTYYNTGTSWRGDYYSITDTAGVRSRWNALMDTGTHSDSMGFSKNAYSPVRIVTASGIVGVKGMAKVFADAGCRIVETTVNTPQAAGWSFQYSPWGYAAYSVPGAGENRTLWASRTVAIRHDAAFSILKGNSADAEFIGSLFIAPLSYALGGGCSLYWHTGGAQGPTTTDPYWSYLAHVLGQEFLLFNRVIQPDNDFTNVPYTPRRSYTAAR